MKELHTKPKPMGGKRKPLGGTSYLYEWDRHLPRPVKAVLLFIVLLALSWALLAQLGGR